MMDKILAGSLAVGLEDQRALLADNRAKTRDAINNKETSVDGEEMGHLVLGDWIQHQNVDRSQETNDAPANKRRWLGPLLCGLGGAAAAGIPLLSYLLTRPAVQSTDTDTDTAYTISLPNAKPEE